MTEYLELLFSDYTVRTISAGTAIMGIVCGVLGSFAVLRGQSLLGDAISHAALPGIAIVFMLTGIKDPFLFFLGALLSGILGTLWILGITKKTHLKSDTALGIVLSVFFGFGILLLTYIQKQPNANQAGLESYLFGQAATIVSRDVFLMAVVGGASLLVIILFWKEFKIIAFDAQFARTIGFRTGLLDILLTSLIVVAIVLGLQTVGVVLMSAMLLAPAAAARQWTNKLSVMVILAAIFGAVSGIIGTVISSSGERIATGPVIVLMAVSIVAISFLLAPGRGLLSRQLRYQKNRKSMRLNKTLMLMYDIASNHKHYDHPHSVSILNNFHGFRKKCLQQLQDKNLIRIKEQNWMLTAEGFEKAKSVYTQMKQDT